MKKIDTITGLLSAIRKMQQQIQYLYSHGGSGGGSVSTAFTTSIPFNNAITELAPTNVSGALTLTPNPSGATAGFGAILRLTADGVHVPNLNAFSLISGVYDNTNGVVNQLLFMFDGVDYCLSINQPISSTTTTTTTASGTTTTTTTAAPTTTTTTTSGGVTIANTAWYARIDSSAAGTVFEDGSGNCNRIHSLTDVEGSNGKDWTQFTVGKVPAVVTSGINGQKTLSFVDTQYMAQSHPGTSSTSLTIFYVIQWKNVTGFKYGTIGMSSRFDSGHSGNGSFNGGDKLFIYPGTGNQIAGTTSLAINTTYVIALKRDVPSTTVKAWINSNLEINQSVPAMATGWEGLMLGHSADGGTFWLKEVAYIQSALSDVDIVTLSNEFKTRNGL